VKKRRAAVVFTIFFLAQAVMFTQTTTAGSYVPNPLTEIRSGAQNIEFKDTCNFLLTALSLYKADVFGKLPKNRLKEIYSPVMNNSNIRFDLDNIDMMKKGWTRYYPFSAGGKQMIARMFLTSETKFQPDVTVLSEAVLENSGVTLQILPGIDGILKDRTIKPNNIYSPSQADKSA
jgi:hypothetical protein